MLHRKNSSNVVSPFIGAPSSGPAPLVPCPLCSGTETRDYALDKKRCYQICDTCSLVFVSPKHHLSSLDERAEYDHHENNSEDIGYRRFLSRLSVPLLGRLKPGSSGLDFGCGPGPTLSVILEEAGHKLALYDKFYATDASVLAGSYDFISATEVVEHLSAPGNVFRQLWSLLAAGGTLALMTKLVINKERFMTWHYKNDQTHIMFFSTTTFTWLANDLGATLEFVDNDVIFLTKTPI
ncbi:class I SAM-dependent methyltransferase [Puniceicoccaceae bacterium K14]|nr:class I SAM-dependent methyltransferase [Puniceicoccaceae bacterium K14]